MRLEEVGHRTLARVCGGGMEAQPEALKLLEQVDQRLVLERAYLLRVRARARVKARVRVGVRVRVRVRVWDRLRARARARAIGLGSEG